MKLYINTLTSLLLLVVSVSAQHIYIRTSSGYAYNSDWQAAVVSEFGAGAEVADWADIKNEFGGSVSALSQFMTDIGLVEYRSGAWVIRNGSQYYSSSRAYFMERHNGSVPSGWLVHDQLQGNTLDLGSWDTSSRLILAKVPLSAELKIHTAVELEWASESGRVYQVQWSTNLATNIWHDLGDPVVGNGMTNYMLQSTREHPARYFQLDVQLDTNPPPVEIDTLSYLNPFGVWVYDSYDEGVGPAYDWTVRSLGTASRNGEPVIIKQEYDEYGGTNDQQFISTDFSSGCEETGWYNHGQGNWYWNEPIPLILSEFVSGQTNYFSGYTRTDIAGIFDVALVITNEQVTVPAGTFDTVRVESIIEILPPSPMAGTYVFNAWYAENIGMVKRVQEDGSLWELKSYNSYTP